MEIILVVLGLAILAWIAWAVYYIRTGYPIDCRLRQYTRR